MKPFNFYIIITPGSLRFLKFALWSLQQRSDFKLTLAANGLERKERDDLKHFCDQIQAVYFQLNSEQVLSHGAALNELLAQHKDPWFCFCDSDIVSTDHMATDISLPENIKAMSSCDAMFWDNVPVKGVLGRCNRWPDGSENISSFFCLYHTETIKFLMQKYKVGFENIAAVNIESKPIQATLRDKGVTEFNRKLDTGKALTAALDLDGHAYLHTTIPSLLHIGGLSSWILNGDKELIHTEYRLTDQDLYQLADSNSWLFNAKALADTENLLFYLRRQQRLAAARYCFQLISHYVDQTPKPKHDLSDKEFGLKIEKIVTTIEAYYAKFT